MTRDGCMKAANAIVGDAQIAVGIIDGSAHEWRADRQAVILVAIIEIVVVVVVGTGSLSENGRTLEVARRPVHGAALVHEVDIFQHRAIDDSTTSRNIFHTVKSVEAIELADTRTVLPRRLVI